MATIDLGKIAITPEGQWSSGKYYEKLSLVIFNGQSYLSLRDTTGDNPETSRSDWMQITSRGESLYQMMVREGKFVGTEEEFTQQYLDSLKACADASDEVRSALSDILDEMDRVRAEISEVMVEEDIRIKNEAKRESAEINRKNADITRGIEERNRQEAEQRREQSMQQIQNDAEIALAMAAEAQQKAEEAILNEEERIKAENQRKIDETTRIQSEEQRVNDEAMRRSREADRQESENIRQKNEGDRILAEREREEIMRNLVEELKALAANRFKIVDVLPEVGEFAVIYLVPSTTPSDNDVYDEWAYVSEKWEHIGSTRFEMDNYFTKEEVEAALDTKANIQHQHTVADITDFPELYYDATAFFTSGAYPSDKYEELFEAVKAKRTVYATIDEAGYVSYIFFVSSANSDGSSSRVLLTTIFADGGYLYINTFVLQQSGMTTLQESITGKADKATTLAGYGIGDAYTKSEVDTALEGKQDTLTAGNGISIEGNVISSSVAEVVDNIVNAGYVFAGVATPATDPSTPNAKVFYIANGKGTYEKFGGIEVTEDEVVVLKYDTAWHKVATGIASDEKLSELVKKNAGVNLFDESNSYAGILDKNGDITSASESYLSHSDFIEIDGNSSYFLSARLSLGGYGYLCYYDKNKALITPTIAMTSENMLLTPPANAKYLRFSYRNNYSNNQIQLNIGTKREDFREYTPIGQYCAEKIAKGVVTSKEIKAETIKYSNIEDNTISPSKTNFFNVGENIFDPNHYRNSYGTRVSINSGNEEPNNEYNTSDYIRIVGNTKYFFSLLGSSIYPRVVAYYTEQKEFIAAERSQRYITTPENAVWMKISGLKEDWEYIMVVKTDTYPSTFIPFGYYLQPNLIKDDSIEISKLKQKVFPKEFGCLSNSGEIASGETLTTAKVNIKQNLLLSYHIDGTIDDIDIGVGYDGTTEEYARTNFKITSGNIIVGSNTYSLGLALGNRTDISISSKGYGSNTPVTITITNEFGDVFSQEISGIGTGTPYIKNNGGSRLIVNIKFFPRDITKKIWIFGDSYVSFVSPARWPYYLVSKGYENFMCNSLPGARADRMIEELRNLLATGAKPTYLLWCLGMNGGGDTYSNGEFVINQIQKGSVDTVISICKENNIIPVLQTIPTVSNNGSPIYHKALTTYIKSLGYRYVDIDNAVGSKDDGTWTVGLLDDDGVHPSVQGAKVICARFLSDFPELSIIE